jgi:hypothetical protein
VVYEEGLLAERAKLKGGRMRYAPLPPEAAGELKQYPVVISDDHVFPPRKGSTATDEDSKKVSRIYAGERESRTSGSRTRVTLSLPGA